MGLGRDRLSADQPHLAWEWRLTQIVKISSVSHSRQSQTISKQWNGCKDKSNLPIMFHQARKWHNTVMPDDFLVFNLLYTFYQDIKTWHWSWNMFRSLTLQLLVHCIVIQIYRLDMRETLTNYHNGEHNNIISKLYNFVCVKIQRKVRAVSFLKISMICRRKVLLKFLIW